MKRFLLLLLLAQPGWAAITFDAVSTSPTTATNATNVSWSHTVGSGCTDALLWVSVTTQDDTVESASTVTYNSDALTFQDGGDIAANLRYESWYRKEPDKGSSFTITVTFPVSKNQILGTARSYCGVHQTTTFGTVVTDEGALMPMSATVSSASGELVIDMGFVASGGTSLTVGADQTQRSNITATGNHIHVTSEQAGAASVEMSWTLGTDNNNFGMLAVALKPSAGGGGGGAVPVTVSQRRRQ